MEVKEYRVYCETDSKHETTWSTTDPTTCPINSSHTIDVNLTTILQTVSKNTFKLKESKLVVGEHFRAITVVLDIPMGLIGDVSTVDIVYPHPISILGLQFHTDENQRFDIINVVGAPDTVIGAIGANVEIGDTVITVSQTVIDNLDIGYQVVLFDGANSNSLGYCYNIDAVNSQITVDTPATTAFSAASPTYVMINMIIIENYEISAPHNYTIGESTVGGSDIPSNIILRLLYTNMTTTAKRFVAQVEFLY